MQVMFYMSMSLFVFNVLQQYYLFVYSVMVKIWVFCMLVKSFFIEREFYILIKRLVFRMFILLVIEEVLGF